MQYDVRVRAASNLDMFHVGVRSPNQVLTHAARAAAKAPLAPLVAARGAREGLWLE